MMTGKAKTRHKNLKNLNSSGCVVISSCVCVPHHFAYRPSDTRIGPPSRRKKTQNSNDPSIFTKKNVVSRCPAAWKCPGCRAYSCANRGSLQSSCSSIVCSVRFSLCRRAWPYRHGGHAFWNLQHDWSCCQVCHFSSDQVDYLSHNSTASVFAAMQSLVAPLGMHISTISMLPMVNFGFDHCQTPLTQSYLYSGERALEQLNYSLIKNRAWYVR